MRCHKCHKKIDWIRQLKKWEKDYGDDWVGEAMVQIFCWDCELPVGQVLLYSEFDVEEVYSPALKAKIQVPSIKKKTIN